jgi:serine/threonine-protein kinase OSR1/STK39
MRDLPRDPSAYQLLNQVGQGSSSSVYEARCLATGEVLALKVIDLDAYPLDIDLLRQEVAFWSSTSHANVVPYYGSFVSGKFLHILMEYLAGGSLADIMRHSFRCGFRDEVVVATILRALAGALAHIHAHGQIHRDIKPGNAVVGVDGAVKIADFGVAASLVEQGRRRQARYTRTGTVCYMAPEVLQERSGHTEKADIWSLGITAIELATGAAPYAALEELDIVQKILRAPPPQLPRGGGFSQPFRDFVRKCMNADPQRRASASELIDHPFMEKASEPSYIVDYVLKDLPPLGDRFAALDSADAMVDNLVHGLAELNEGPMSLPVKVEWSFHEERELPPIKKGRFTIKREQSAPPSPTRGPIPMPETALEEMTRKVQELTAENARLRRQVAQLTGTVAQLTERLKGKEGE